MITEEYYQYGNFLSVRDSSLYEKIIPEKGILITKFLFAENRFYARFFDDFAFGTRAEALAWLHRAAWQAEKSRLWDKCEKNIAVFIADNSARFENMEIWHNF